MRKLFTLAAAFLMGTAAYGADSSSLIFELKDGTTQSVEAAGLVMNISDGELTATNGATSVSISMNSLSKFYFSFPSGVVKPNLAEYSPVDVYDMNGVAVGTFDSLNSSLGALPAGVYVVKNQVSTFKIVVR